jgi:hypothetical protein
MLSHFNSFEEEGFGDVTQCAVNCDMFNDDPVDLNGDYADIKDP